MQGPLERRRLADRVRWYEGQRTSRARRVVVAPAILLLLAVVFGAAGLMSPMATKVASAVAIMSGVGAVIWYVAGWLGTYGFPIRQWSEDHEIGKEIGAAVAQDADLYEKCVKTGFLRVHVMGRSFL